MDIQLNFINNSNDANNSQVVIFQKNEGASMSELAVAWTVIQNCGQGSNHPFTYPMETTVSAKDSDGNHTQHQAAAPGQAFQMVMKPSGHQLVPVESSSSPTELQVLNSLQQGAIDANVYKAGRLLVTRTQIAPGQKAVFQFKPRIWLGVVSQVVQGAVMNAAILSAINTEISLLGIASADIVMTGGGAGPEARPFEFTLQNLVMA